jgi:phenylpyruvate tautomerase
MPLLRMSISKKIDENNKSKLLKQLSEIVSECFNKPENYVMIVVEEKAIMMSGTTEPAAFAVLKSIGGITAKNNKMFSSRLCALLKDQLGIGPDRVYINFSDVAAANWGWNGDTFA